MRAIHYKDHMAYQFENNETVFAIAQRVMLKLKNEQLMNGLELSCNGKARIVYDVQTVKPLLNALPLLDSRTIYQILMQLLNLVIKFEESDFLQKEAIDMDIRNMYFDNKMKQLKCCALPVNCEVDYHDQASWQMKYRQALATILKVCFKDAPRGYEEIYNQIFDGVKSDIEITEFLLTCNYQWYGLGSKVTGKALNEEKINDLSALSKMANSNDASEWQKESEYLAILECNSHTGQNVIYVDCDEFTLGAKNGSAMGKITVGAPSRNHCTITKTNGVLTVIDNKSTNGSFINGFRLNPGTAYKIKNGDILRLADVEFRVKIDG